MERGIGGMRVQRREESGAAGAEDQEIGAQAAHHVGRQPRSALRVRSSDHRLTPSAASAAARFALASASTLA